MKSCCAALLMMGGLFGTTALAEDIGAQDTGTENPDTENPDTENTGTGEDSVLDARLNSFLAGGYGPVTALLDWFDPVDPVAGDFRGDPPVLAPDARTLPAGPLEAAAAYAADRDSMALIVMRGDAVEFERYWQGAGRDSRFNPQSMSKTVLGLLVGAAIRDGHIGGVDDPVGRYVPALAADPRGRITIGNLLQMSGGLSQLTTSYEVTRDNPGVVQFFGTDFIAPIFTLDQADPPGSRWEYNNDETNLLGHLLTLATGTRYTAYLSETLWKPLGLKGAGMYMDRPGGAVMMSCCIFSRPMDFLKIGMLIRDRGRYDGRQIVPADWVDAMTAPAETNKGYGYQIWLGDRAVSPVRPDGPPSLSWASEPYAAEDMIVMVGFGFQRVWIVPSLDLVILRAGRAWPDNWDESVIPNLLIRAAREPS